jgi:general secretion pathway protein H
MLAFRDGKLRYSLDRGFTMIEMLVVILIIGIIVNLVAVNLGGNRSLDQLETEVQRFRSLTELALEEALLRTEIIGIEVEDDAYRFMRRADKTWETIDDNLFRDRNLPESLRLKLATEATTTYGSKQTDKTPDIILLPSGELTPFELVFSSSVIDDRFRITGEATGKLSLEHITDE